MDKQIFPWIRYWCPPDAELYLDDQGYLSDQGSFIANEHTHTLADLKKASCLILIGEPGSGKTTETKLEAERVAMLGNRVVRIDLHSVLGFDDIIKNPIILAWLKNQDELTLFLDALDECPMGIAVFWYKLVHWLESLPRERLLLRITCRTADWSALLELAVSDLQRLYPDWKSYEITPLDRVAVSLAVQASGLSVETTLLSFAEHAAGPFAARPLTLKMLLRFLKEGMGLPHRREDLFYVACLALCEEDNPARRADKKVGQLDPEQRLIIAGRIALYTLARRTDGISQASQVSSRANDLRLSDLAGGNEIAGGNSFQVNEAMVRETLATALFTARGVRMGWSHQAYPDFLAAWYIHQRKLPPRQVSALLLHSPTNIVIPHLSECAAWLGCMDPSFLAELIEKNPTILLRSDEAALGIEDRAKILGSLLTAFEEKRLHDLDLGYRGVYRRLAHPHMADRLRPYIVDRVYNFIVRRAAIDIAEQCRVVELVDVLAQVALNVAEDMNTREQAAHAIKEIGDLPTKKRLAGILKETPQGASGELQGIVLDALYPEGLSFDNALIYLKNRPIDNVIRYGAYEGFISKLEDTLSDKHLIEALIWVKSMRRSEEVYYSTRNFMEEIFSRGWQNILQPGMLDVLASAVFSRLRIYDNCWSTGSEGARDEVNEGRGRRISIVRCLIEKASLMDGDMDSFVYGSNPTLIRQSDLDALLVELDAASEANKDMWARLIRRTVYIHDRVALEKILRVCGRCPQLASVYADVLVPVRLGSPEAERQKKDYQSRLRIHKLSSRETKPGPTIAELLNDVRKKTNIKWWDLASFLGGNFRHLPKPTIEKSSLWLALDDSSKAQVIAIAAEYQEECAPPSESWQKNPRSIPFLLLFGRPALRLVFVTEPERLAKLEVQKWQAWVPSLIIGADHLDEVDRALLERGHQVVPDAILSVLRFNLQKNTHAIWNLGACWDKAIEALYIEEAFKPSCDPQLFETLLRVLLQQKSELAFKMACSEFTMVPRTRAHAVRAGYIVLEIQPSEGYPFIRQVLKSDTLLGREIFEGAAQQISFRSKTIADGLSIQIRGEIFEWLEHQYPHDTDPGPPNGYVTQRQMLTEMRDGFLISIRDSGEDGAVEEIARLEKEFPGHELLPWNRVTAIKMMAQKSALPPSIHELRELTHKPDFQLVQTGEQLLDLIIESLQRLENELQGTTPSIRSLWDQLSKKEWRPKDESHLSDYIKRHLEKDLKKVVASREVEVKKKQGSPRGDSIDVYITKVGNDDKEPLTVIIEVKGDWNDGVMTSMETQLRDQYLIPRRSRFGLYIVGWYQAKNKQSRSKVISKTIDAAKHSFVTQAKAISTPVAQIRSFVLDARLPENETAVVPNSRKKRSDKPASKKVQKRSRNAPK